MSAAQIQHAILIGRRTWKKDRKWHKAGLLVAHGKSGDGFDTVWWLASDDGW